MYIDVFDKKIAELHKYAKKDWKERVFRRLPSCDKMHTFDCFAEIIYDGELSKEENASALALLNFMHAIHTSPGAGLWKNIQLSHAA